MQEAGVILHLVNSSEYHMKYTILESSERLFHGVFVAALVPFFVNLVDFLERLV